MTNLCCSKKRTHHESKEGRVRKEMPKKSQKNQRFKDLPNYFQVEGTFDVFTSSKRAFLCNLFVDLFLLTIASHLLVGNYTIPSKLRLIIVDFFGD
jgi:hypothetical protein